MNTSKTSGNSPKFSDLGIAEDVLKALERRGFIDPTPIQHQVIPSALEGKDVVGIAQTGTGKTLAFGVPLIQRLTQGRGQGLILLPTRELALQVNEEIARIGTQFGMRSVVLIGGAPMGPQIKQLRARPHLVIATPGRLVDHLQRSTYALDRVSVIVLDEADRMLDIGFQKEITQIMKDAPRGKQSMLFSATMPAAISKLAVKYMKMPLRIEVAPQGTSAKNVEQELFVVEKPNKTKLLEKILADNPGTALVFSRTKHGAKRIARTVRAMSHTAAEIHSNRSLNQRKEALAGFKSGKYRVLVATDIAARGIDVQNISTVINYDLPDNSEDYVHRIGRTGRAGASGKAVSFATSSQRADVKKIERLIRKTLPILQLPADLPKQSAKPQQADEDPDHGDRSKFFRERNVSRSRGGRGNSGRGRSGGGRPASRTGGRKDFRRKGGSGGNRRGGGGNRSRGGRR